MMKFSFFFCLTIFLCFFTDVVKAQEQNFNVKATVVDSLSAKPGSYFTVLLKADTSILRSVVADENGSFEFKGLKNGKYVIALGAIGYQAKQVHVDLNGNLNLGKILVKPQGNDLKEVAIVAARPIIKQEPDRIVYDTQADPEGKVLSVLDMMRKVPLLSVDAEDNVKMKGTGNYKILINGKPSGVLSRDPKEFLKSMPASSVQKIEVITTPPSKYESEGLSGIINIITSQKVGNGYNGNINARMQEPFSPGLNANFTFKQGDFGANLYGGTGVWRVDGIRVTDRRNSIGSAPVSNLYALGFQKIDNFWAWGGGEFSYEIDSLNLLTAEINPYGGYNQQDLAQRFDLQEGNIFSNYDLASGTRYEWSGTDYTLNYQRGFKNKKEHLLTFSYKFFDNKEPQFNDVKFSNTVNFSGDNYRQDNISKSSEQTAQLDYVNPFKIVNLEAGVKTIIRRGETDFKHFTFDDVQNDYVIDPLQSNVYNNEQYIYSVYNTYTLKVKDWTFKAGARLEATNVNAFFESTSTKLKTSYSNLIPSVSFNRTLKNSQSVSVGFTQRIQRPGIWDLNPFVDKSRPNFEYSGNPDLEAVLSNNFELTYSNFKKGSINVSLTYNFANNTLQRVINFDEAENLTKVTILNIGEDRLLGTNINFSYPLTKKWNVNLSGNLNHTWIEGMIDESLTKNSGVTGYASFNTGYKFEHQWKASISANYNAPNVLLQGKTNDYYYIGFSGSKDIIKDKLTFSASVANPFQKYRAYTNVSEGINFMQERIRENYFRRIMCSLNWKFGKLDGGIKKSERSISNDDTKKSSN